MVLHAQLCTPVRGHWVAAMGLTVQRPRFQASRHASFKSGGPVAI
jgi:hypothetical protein